MRRRELIIGLASVAATCPFAARAQQSRKLHNIGFLGANPAHYGEWAAAFAERMGQLGWIDGQTVAIDYRWSEGRPERVAEAVAEFVQRRSDVIVTYGSAVKALRQAMPATPIVFALSTDPVGGGLVASLSRPGGNTTGLSMEAATTAGKRLELLRDVVPNLHHLVVLFDAGYPAAVRESAEVQAAARALGVDVTLHGIRHVDDVAPVFEVLKLQSDALYVVEDALTADNVPSMLKFALGARLPTSFTSSKWVKAGGLMSYGPSYPAMFRRAAEMVDKILRGTKPADIPVEQPSKFEFVVNMKTAQTLGLTAAR
jgi:putative tryptophan/tyrosine transport system substrate-binding protein